MKNRNYLIFGNIIAVVLGIIFAMLTSENTAQGYYIYLDPISWVIIVFPLILFYITAFPDINQNSNLKITQYKMKWMQDMTILLGINATFIGFVFIWGGILSIGMYEENISPVFKISRSISIAFITMIYALLISFSFYLLTFFIKEPDDVPVFKPNKRKFINIFSIGVNIIIFLICLTIGSTSTSVVTTLSNLGILNKYILLFFVGIVVFFHFQPKSSLSLLIKNFFCDCEEETDSIKGQLQAIMRTKRFIIGLCLIALVFFPTALFSTLSYVINDSANIFSLLITGTQIMLWGFVTIIVLTTLEGKYNYKLFQNNGSIVEDRLFLPKFVALPTILYLLMVVILFILFNVLF